MSLNSSIAEYVLNSSIAKDVFNKTTNNTAATLNTSSELLIFNICFLSLAVLIVIANAVVLAVYFRTPQLHSNNNTLLISLAFTDLFAGGLNIPALSISAFIAKKGRNLIALHFIGNVLSDFTIIVNELNLFLIFLNRYLIICYPLASRKIITKQRIRALIIIIWVVSTLVALLPLTWCYKVLLGEPHTEAYREQMATSISHHSIAVSVCCFILPSLFMFFFLVSMMHSINEHKKKRKRRRSKSGSCRGKQSRRVFNSYVKAFCMLLAMYALMLFAWSPLMFVRFCLDLQIKIAINSQLLHAFMILRFVTAFINPFIYTLIKREFRSALLKKIRCC